MEIIRTADMDWERLRVSSRNMRTSRKLLRDGEATPGIGLYALLVKTHEGEEVFTAPRHRHNFSQIRMGLQGQMNFGPGLGCQAGEIGFFPGGAHYGPEEIAGAEYLLLQWGPDWVTRDQDRRAIDELSTRGRFERGVYISEQDGVEIAIDGKRAVWEHIYNRPEVIREPRYRSPVMMTPDNFDWIAGDNISHKTLGRFTEDDVTIAMVRWDRSGGTYEVGAERTSLIMVLEGCVLAQAHNCGPETVVWSEYNETTLLVGETDSIVVIFGFPLPRPNAGAAGSDATQQATSTVPIS
jgi:hypothetical protein